MGNVVYISLGIGAFVIGLVIFPGDFWRMTGLYFGILLIATALTNWITWEARK